MRLISLLFLSLLVMNANAQKSYLVDWDEVGEESIEHLVQLVQIDTSNPPGNESEVVKYLQSVLAAEGIASQTYALEADRANLVARIKGNGSIHRQNVKSIWIGARSGDGFSGKKHSHHPRVLISDPRRAPHFHDAALAIPSHNRLICWEHSNTDIPTSGI